MCRCVCSASPGFAHLTNVTRANGRDDVDEADARDQGVACASQLPSVSFSLLIPPFPSLSLSVRVLPALLGPSRLLSLSLFVAGWWVDFRHVRTHNTLPSFLVPLFHVA